MDLLRNYPAGYNVLPTANPNDVVDVSLQMALYHIVDMNERDQTLTTNCEIITKVALQAVNCAMIVRTKIICSGRTSS